MPPALFTDTLESEIEIAVTGLPRKTELGSFDSSQE